MLDQERIKLMMKMAAYEQTKAKEDWKIGTYYRKDYVSFNVVITAIWVTIGYALAAGLFAIGQIEFILEEISVPRLFTIAAFVFGVYVVLVIIYCVYASGYYGAKHNKAKHRIKRYYRDLSQLEKMMTKERE